MALTIKVSIKGEIADVLADGKALATQNGMKFWGDTSKGGAEGHGIKGTYSVKGKEITIVITEKPWYITEGMIKSAILNWFRGR